MAFFAPDIGIDLGTSNTSVYVRGRGIVISEPTLVLVDRRERNHVLAVGDEASYLMGRTPENVALVEPLRGGIIDDYDMTEVMLRYFIRKAIGKSHVLKSNVLVSVPCSLHNDQRRQVRTAVMRAGARKVELIEKPYAAALGSGLPVYEPIGSMVVDIGGGTTDAALVAIGGLVVAKSIPVGGQQMDAAVASHIKREFNTLVGARTAEDVKLDLGTALPLNERRRVQIRGKDSLFYSAKTIEFDSAQCCAALQEPCTAILSCIKWVLERTPPELAADIMRGGIHLTGGASQLFALDQYIANELNIPVLLAKEPTECTAMGLGYLVENMRLLSTIGPGATPNN